MPMTSPLFISLGPQVLCAKLLPMLILSVEDLILCQVLLLSPGSLSQNFFKGMEGFPFEEIFMTLVVLHQFKAFLTVFNAFFAFNGGGGS